MFSLKGKVALVTGGAGHLGTPISYGLAKAGATVIIASRDVAKCRSLASKITHHHMGWARGMELDVSNKLSIETCVKQVIKTHSRLDILVNNAVYTHSDNFYYGLDGTVGQVYDCCMSVMPHMKHGSIINIASIYGIVSPNQKMCKGTLLDSPASYVTGKGAVIALTKYLACKYSQHRFNAVSYGFFPNSTVASNKELMKKLDEHIPLGRVGKDKEVAGAVVFLASGEAGYVTGHNLVVDGGYTLW